MSANKSRQATLWKADFLTNINVSSSVALLSDSVSFGLLKLYLSKSWWFDFCSYKFKLEEGAEIKPRLPLLNNRIYDNKFESQLYAISDVNKVAAFKFQVFFWPRVNFKLFCTLVFPFYFFSVLYSPLWTHLHESDNVASQLMHFWLLICKNDFQRLFICSVWFHDICAVYVLVYGLF